MPATTHPSADTYDTFVEGELVMLKSGGPLMTVNSTCDDCGEVLTDWFTYDDAAGWVHEREEFPPEALVRVH